MPHAHILLWLENPIHPNDIDSLISAELPDKNEDPTLFEIVTNNMIHGPCGNYNERLPCMQGNPKNCTKRYPRKFVKDTQTGEDGYPLYRRRSPQHGGFTHIIKENTPSQYVVDNRFIVPYSALLCKIFNAHINVEFCNSVKSIKYVCKYVNKGSDMAVFGIHDESRNEVQNFVTGRYVSSNEAIWRIFGFPIHEHFPSVTHLAVHLENGQRVYYTDNTSREEIQRRGESDTTLTAFFKLCREDPFARALLYFQLPRHYTWKNKKWKRRAGNVESAALGRVYTVHPNYQECYFLRILLHTVEGPTSFQDIKTVDNIVCLTYREACRRRGLLENDQHLNDAMSEAALCHSPEKLRSLFCIILQMCHPADPLHIWETHKESLTEDILHKLRRRYPTQEIGYSDDIYNKGLILIEDKLLQLGGNDLQSIGMPQPRRGDNRRIPNEVLTETTYDLEYLENYIEQQEPRLTREQKNVYNAVLDSLNSSNNNIFFLCAAGGTGKTFLLNLILAKVRSLEHIALAVAPSGIAATLLEGGRTSHSTFKLPLDLPLQETPICNVKRGTAIATLLQNCKLIVWDECTMSHKKAYEAVNRTLQDLRGNTNIMGGVTFLMCGDFRQTLPVITRGTRADEIAACIKNSILWRHVRKLNLTKNMRVHQAGTTECRDFAEKLLNLGEGNIVSNDDFITLPFGISCNSQQELLQCVFKNLNRNGKADWFKERAILAPLNETVHRINFEMLSKLQGNIREYCSIDRVVDPEEAVSYPIEFLNSLKLSNVPLHILKLKIGAPIMLLRNLNPPKLCNGTRMIVKNLYPNVIEAEIISGKFKGEYVFLPKIPFIPRDVPFQFKRVQFPVQLCFAMTINKAQGQTLKVVGLELTQSCFSHGQLYVGCSRTGNSNDLYHFIPDKKTKNIVYKEILQ